MGFETRGTEISKRINSWNNLLKETTYYGPLIVNPKLLNLSTNRVVKTRKKPKIKLKNSTNQKMVNKSLSIEKDDYFCGDPSVDYSQIILESKTSKNLFNEHVISEMCEFENHLVSNEYYVTFCQTTNSNQCCRIWSLPNYIAALSNKTNCHQITASDINSTLDLLKRCSSYFYRNNLHECEERSVCLNECERYNAVYNIFQFIVDIHFLPEIDVVNKDYLKDVTIFLPLAASQSIMPFYEHFDIDNLNDQFNNIEIVAMNLGLFEAEFDRLIFRDAWLCLLGLLAILICHWCYTSSILLSMMIMMTICNSIIITYFLYTVCFSIHFFPFINLLAIVIIIGVGADNCFVFYKIWKQQKCSTTTTETYKSIIIKHTPFHSELSAIVTSITTAVAFYASYFSHITILSCFGIFAGTAIVVNLILTFTWFPASMILCEPFLNKKLLSDKVETGSYDDSFDEKFFKLIEQFKYVLILIFVIITLISCYVVFITPGMEFLDTKHFQLFDKTHPFEMYFTKYEKLFRYDNNPTIQQAQIDEYKIPLRFVWGVLPQDTGNYLDPTNRGALVYDDTFDMSDPKSQIWLLNFCRSLRKQSFYQSTIGPLLSNCMIETFYNWMQRKCIDPITKQDTSPCCNTTRFPYDSNVFKKCIVDVVFDLYQTPQQFFSSKHAGVKFSKIDNSIKVLVVEYDSSYLYTTSYTELLKFYALVEKWLQTQLVMAPEQMRNVFFISDFEFFDLQNSVFNIYSPVLLSLVISFSLLFLTTLNLYISVLAILSILSSIIATIALLILLGWKLYIVESIAIITTIGLSTDFCLHFAIHFSYDNQQFKSIYKLMVCPSLAAALTTALAGVFVLPSSVLAYKQIGMFLIILMFVCWLYSCFFYSTILYLFEPTIKYFQLLKNKQRSNNDENIEIN